MRIEKTSGVVKREIAGEVFLVPVTRKLADMQNLFVLEGCGAFIWDCIEGVTDRQSLIAKVVDEFDVSEQTASGDVDGFIELLSKEALVSITG